MKNRIVSFTLIIVMLISMCTVGAAASGEGLSNFKAINTYTDGKFTDVASSDWYAQYAATTYRLGLMQGPSETFFNAAGNVTIAETITLAARLHSIYYTGSCTVVPGDPWYQGYVDYAMENSIISQNYADYNRPATRAEYAAIVYRSFPEEAYKIISEIDDGAIPDVPMTRSYADAVYHLYRGGILTGSDAKGTFYPDSNISRSEVAAIIARMADSSQRKEFSLIKRQTMDAVEIAKKCASSVFYIEVYDIKGNVLKTGSGFFIDPSGIAVTNYHVVSGGASAAVMLTNGETHEVLGVFDYDEDYDVAMLKIEGSNYDYLETGTDAVAAGQTIYAIGSPYGFDNSISQGIVANPVRTIDGISYIQFTAQISSGSSGGAIIDDSGKVVGISTSTFIGSENISIQNINLALPISVISRLSREEYISMTDLLGPSSGWLFIENAENQVVGVDVEAYLPVYFGADDYVTIEWSYLYDAEKYVKLEWGEFEDGWIPLYAEGLQEGYAIVEIDLYNADESLLLDTEYIYIQVIKAEITVSDTAPSIKSGGSLVLNFFADVGDFESTFYLTYEVEDTSIVSCKWAEEWDGMSIDMTVTGEKRGSTKIYVWMWDDFDNCITGGYVQVTVN